TPAPGLFENPVSAEPIPAPLAAGSAPAAPPRPAGTEDAGGFPDGRGTVPPPAGVCGSVGGVGGLLGVGACCPGGVGACGPEGWVPGKVGVATPAVAAVIFPATSCSARTSWAAR